MTLTLNLKVFCLITVNRVEVLGRDHGPNCKRQNKQLDRHLNILERSSKKKIYFRGQARHPYCLRKRLDDSFEGDSPSMEGVCDVCSPALSKYYCGRFPQAEPTWLQIEETG